MGDEFFHVSRSHYPYLWTRGILKWYRILFLQPGGFLKNYEIFLMLCNWTKFHFFILLQILILLYYRQLPRQGKSLRFSLVFCSKDILSLCLGGLELRLLALALFRKRPRNFNRKEPDILR